MLTINGLVAKLTAAGIKNLTPQALRGRVALGLVTKPFDADKVTRGRTAFYPDSAFPDNYAVAKLLYFQGDRLTSDFVKDVKNIATAMVTDTECLINGTMTNPWKYYPTGDEQTDIPYELARYYIAYYSLAYLNIISNVAVKIDFLQPSDLGGYVSKGAYLACTADYEPQSNPQNSFEVSFKAPGGFSDIDFGKYADHGDDDIIRLPDKISCKVIL